MIMNEEVFRGYIAEFNTANFDALARYYADDVIFCFNGGLTLNGRDAIIDFYRPFRKAVDESVDIRFLVMDDKHIAVEMATEFRAREDYQNFTRGPLKAGDVVRITSFVHYDIGPDGRFSSIRVGRYGDASLAARSPRSLRRVAAELRDRSDGSDCALNCGGIRADRRPRAARRSVPTACRSPG
jgi:hypothetical protein